MASAILAAAFRPGNQVRSERAPYVVTAPYARLRLMLLSRHIVAIGVLIAAAVAISPASAASLPQGVHVNHQLAGAFARSDVVDVGPLSPNTIIPAKFVLRYRNQRDLDQLVQEQADPRSPLHGHFLTTAQFKNYFAPSDAVYSAVLRDLRARGYSITKIYPNNTVVETVAPTSAIETSLDTKMRMVIQTGKGERYTNLTEPVIPRSLSASVAYVTGLSNVVIVQPASYQQSTPASAIPTPSSGSSRNARSAVTPSIGGPIRAPDGVSYGPAEISADFDLPGQYGYLAAARSVGIITGGNVSGSDLGTYQNYYQVNRGTSAFYDVNFNGGGTFNPNDGNESLEATLDVQTVIGLAQQANVYLATAPAPLTNSEIISAVQYFNNANNVAVVTLSYAFCTGDDQNSAESLSTLV